MTLEEYVITYKLDGETESLINMVDYYDRYVHSLSDIYKKTSFTKSRTVLCCLHNDVNPSLGLVNNKTHVNVKNFHCFGCGLAGTVVRFHQLVEKEHHNRNLTIEESAIELLRLYNIPLDQVDQVNSDANNNLSSYARKMRKIKRAMGTYTIQELREDLYPARDLSLNLSIEDRQIIINNALVKMTATKKKLFEE